MKHKLLLITFLLFSNSLIAKVANKQSGKKSPYYLSGTLFDSDERHFSGGFKIPLYNREGSNHSLKIDTKHSSLDYDQIKQRFNYYEFYSTTVSYNFRKRRGDGKTPWIFSIGKSIHGHDWLKNRQSTLQLRLMTGHKSDEGRWSYGLNLSNNGAFSGMPLPFFVYSTTIYNQHVRAGFPFVSISGPKENIWNYDLKLSPIGVAISGIRSTGPDSKVSLNYIFNSDSYKVDSEQFDDKESLLIMKQAIYFEHSIKVKRKIELKTAIGHEYNRKFFKGRNIFKRDDDEYDLNSASYLKLSIGIKFR